MLRKVEPLDRLDPLLGKDQPPGDIHKEHSRRGDRVLLADEHGGLVPRNTQLGTNGNTHPPVAKDPAPKVSDHQGCVNEPLQLRVHKSPAARLQNPTEVKDRGTHVHQ